MVVLHLIALPRHSWGSLKYMSHILYIYCMKSLTLNNISSNCPRNPKKSQGPPQNPKLNQGEIQGVSIVGETIEAGRLEAAGVPSFLRPVLSKQSLS